MAESSERASRVNRLLDAIELIQHNRREEAVLLLRELLGEDEDNEEVWLWMSVAVDSMDKSIVCLDNVLRINPKNAQAAGALYRLREAEMGDERKRASLRQYRDFALLSFWLLIIGVMYAIIHTYSTLPVKN